MIDGKRVIAACFPGETFSADWVMCWTVLFGYMTNDHIVIPMNGYSSDAHVTREMLSREILKTEPKPDYVLWLDDDNLLSYEQFKKLLHELETIPEASAVCGWCWTAGGLPSCGYLDKDLLVHTLPPDLLRTGQVCEIGYTGFPVVLMKTETLEQTGPHAFARIPNEKSTWGCLGEDVSFCYRSTKAGGKWYVDTSVHVPHLKLGPIAGPHAPISVMQPPQKQEQAA